MKAIILAGGKGTRLYPYTTIFPKALIPLNQKPILELILKQLKFYGFSDTLLAVGHLAELITAFFSDGRKFNIKIHYYREDNPLGTAGPLSLMRSEIDESFLMMNGDILTKLNYSSFLDFHKKSNGIASVAMTKRIINIDFGIPEIDNKNNIIGYSEKPQFEYFISMGIYAFEPRVLNYIKPNEYLDFPDLIKKLIDSGEVVKGYIYNGYWLDIGRHEDYDKANKEVTDIFPELFSDNYGI